MKTEFFISFTLLTPEGPQHFARFSLGNDRRSAARIFSELQGSEDRDRPGILQLEFMEITDGLPVNIQFRDCTLEQLSWNCKFLAKEAFRRAGLQLP